MEVEMKHWNSNLVLVLSLLLCSCGGEMKSKKTSVEADMAAIRSLLFDKVMDAARRGDLDTYLSLYADDAIWMPKDRMVDAGKKEVRSFYSFMDRYTFDQELTLDEIQVIGDWAYVRITADGWIVPKPGISGDRIRAVSRHMMILRKQADGNWKFTRDIFINPLLPEETEHSDEADS